MHFCLALLADAAFSSMLWLEATAKRKLHIALDWQILCMFYRQLQLRKVHSSRCLPLRGTQKVFPVAAGWQHSPGKNLQILTVKQIISRCARFALPFSLPSCVLYTHYI